MFVPHDKNGKRPICMMNLRYIIHNVVLLTSCFNGGLDPRVVLRNWDVQELRTLFSTKWGFVFVEMAYRVHSNKSEGPFSGGFPTQHLP